LKSPTDVQETAVLSGNSSAPIRGVQRWIWPGIALTMAAWVFFPVLVYDPELQSLAELWLEDDNYSYGLLIPPLALYFVWENRAALGRLPVSGTAWGLVPIGLSLALFAMGVLGGVNFFPRLSALLLFAGGILWVGGWAWGRALGFPMLLLLLSIPIPRFVFIQIAFPLQLFASEVAEQVLFWIGVPVMREGNVIHLPHASLEVAEACSGLRSLLALVTTGVVFAYFFGRGWAHWLLIAGASLPIAILVNAVRVTGTGYLAHRYGIEVATGYYHSLEGFAMFGMAFTLLAVFGFAVVRLVPSGGGPEEDPA
jgi:exosortase